MGYKGHTPGGHRHSFLVSPSLAEVTQIPQGNTDEGTVLYLDVGDLPSVDTLADTFVQSLELRHCRDPIIAHAYALQHRSLGYILPKKHQCQTERLLQLNEVSKSIIDTR